MAIEMTVPMVQFNKRAIPEGRVDYDWVQENSEDIFSNKRVVVFSLPGAFTPTCSSTHLPGYEANYKKILEQARSFVCVLHTLFLFEVNLL